MIRFCFCLTCAFLCGIGVETINGQDLPLPVADLKRIDPVDFASEVMPILKQNCLACHHEKEAEGGLVLESLASILGGGDSGEAVKPHDVDSSLLFTRARGLEEPLMPPEDNAVGASPLTPEELALLRLWIEQGAVGKDASASESIDWQPIPESVRNVYAMDVAPDGQFAAIGRGNRIAVVDMATHQEVARLVDPSLHMGPSADVDLIQSVVFSPDANRIATGGFRTVRIWKKSTPPIDPAKTALSRSAGMVAIGPDHNVAAIVNAIGDVEIWDLSANSRHHTLVGQMDRVVGLAWASDRIFSMDQSGRIVVWQASTGARLAELATGSSLSGLAVAPDGVFLSAIDSSGKAPLFRVGADGSSVERIFEAAGSADNVLAVTFVAKPVPLVIVSSETGGVVMIQPSDNNVVRKVDHGAPVHALAVTTDQTRLITGGRDGKIRMWTVADGKPGVTMEGAPELRLQVAVAERDAKRQQAALTRLNQKTGELEKLLAKEDEVVKKAAEEHKKATETHAAEEKKRSEAVAATTATEAKIAKADDDAKQAAEMIAAANKLLASASQTSASASKLIETKETELAAAREAAQQAAQQLAAIAKAKDDADALVRQLSQQIAESQSSRKKADEQSKAARSQLDQATKMSTEVKAAKEKAIKELDAQKKQIATVEEAKKKSEAEVTKRKQVLDAAQRAQQRASAAVPEHKKIIESETRRSEFLDRQLTSIQSRMTGPGKEVIGVAVSGDDQFIAARHGDGSVLVYRVSDGLPTHRFVDSSPKRSAGITFAGDLICGYGSASPSMLWSRRVRWVLERTIGTIDNPSIISDRVTALDFRKDGLSLAVGSGPPSRSGEVKLFAVGDGRMLRDFGDVHSDSVLGLQFSPDGRRIASSAADKTIRILDVATGKVVRSLEGHTHHVLAVAWQDDGQTIASASADQSIKIWNAETGEQRRTISGFAKEITAIEFVQTSGQIVTACADGILRLSDSSNGKAIRTFNASGEFLAALSVTPDGKKLLAGGQSGNVRFWTLDDGKLVHETK